MNTKVKFIVLSLFCMVSTTLNAQQYYAFGGLSASNVSFQAYGYEESGYVFGGNIGFLVDVPLNEENRFETGINLSNKGFILHPEFGDREKVRLTYLEIPLAFKYIAKQDIPKDDFQAFLLGGIFVGVGLHGRIEIADDTKNAQWGHGSENDYFSRLDSGIKLGFGVQYRNYGFQIVQNFGLVDLYSDQDFDATPKMRTTQFSVLIPIDLF